MFVKWFTINWYKYLFAKKSKCYNWFDVIKCRMRGHYDGVVWYNPCDGEPDMTCKGCGDDLS